MRFASITSLGLIVAALSGCSGLNPPNTGADAAPGVLAAAYPDLLTVRQIAAIEGDLPLAELSLSEQQDLARRLALLRARAARLNDAVLTDDERARLGG